MSTVRVHATTISRDAAKQAGASRYFTGEPCKFGHIAQRYVSTLGCVMCVAAARKDWAARNPEKLSEIDMRTRSNPANKALRAARERARYRAANPNWNPPVSKSKSERLAEIRLWRRDYYARRKEMLLAINRVQRAKRAGAEGCHSASDVLKLVAAQNSCCACCRCSISKSYHVDHIIPLARGGTNWPNNLQLLCAPCNLQKGAKLPEEWNARRAAA